MKADPKTRVLTNDEFRARIAKGCCPVCFVNLRRAMNVRKTDDGSGRMKVVFNGAYFECSGDDGWKCYYLSPGTDKSPPRETISAPAIVVSSSPAVIKRRRAA